MGTVREARMVQDILFRQRPVRYLVLHLDEEMAAELEALGSELRDELQSMVDLHPDMLRELASVPTFTDWLRTEQGIQARSESLKRLAHQGAEEANAYVLEEYHKRYPMAKVATGRPRSGSGRTLPTLKFIMGALVSEAVQAMISHLRERYSDKEKKAAA